MLKIKRKEKMSKLPEELEKKFDENSWSEFDDRYGDDIEELFQKVWRTDNGSANVENYIYRVVAQAQQEAKQQLIEEIKERLDDEVIGMEENENWSDSAYEHNRELKFHLEQLLQEEEV